MDPGLVILVFNRMTEFYWSSPRVANDFISYDLDPGTVHGYPAGSIAPVKHQKVDDGLMGPFIAPAIDVNRLPGVTRKTLSEVDGNY